MHAEVVGRKRRSRLRGVCVIAPTNAAAAFLEKPRRRNGRGERERSLSSALLFSASLHDADETTKPNTTEWHVLGGLRAFSSAPTARVSTCRSGTPLQGGACGPTVLELKQARVAVRMGAAAARARAHTARLPQTSHLGSAFVCGHFVGKWSAGAEAAAAAGSGGSRGGGQ